ncbi:MAG TPA: hypothetical protein VGP76_16085 [Planctomycetaceae bacterium]|nr:hypothetical protein [Planctomycetaceae bacterium]
MNQLATKHRTARHTPRVARARRAFTLLEVLLAVGLSLLLVLAIAMAIDLYRRMTTAAQDDLSEMRLVRAVFNKFEVDIRSVVPPQPIASATAATGSPGSTPGSNSGGSGASSSSSQSTGSSGGGDPLQYVYSRSVFGLYGDGDSLVLDTLTPHRLPLSAQQQTGAQAASSQSSDSSSNLAGVHGDMKVVGYFVLGEGTSPILPTSAGSGQLTPEGKVMSSGLARLEGERTAIGYAMETSSTSSLSARIIAPEVQSIAFRYFDGSNWVASWSGATAQALPQAVEIVITVGSSDPYNARTQAARDQAARTYRHVVAITTAAAPQLISEQTINSTTANMSQ